VTESWEARGTEAGEGADPYGTWDAAYVLGALAPPERRAYEEHLAGCASCQRAVAEIAGLPGLLAQVTPDEAAPLAGEAGTTAPPTLLPALIGQARTRGRRATGLLVGLAAALALLAGTLGGLAWGQLGPFAAEEPYRVAFAPVREPVTVTANVEVIPGRDGTRFRVDCQYARGKGQPAAYEMYGIWITDRDGNAALAKTWPVRTGRRMTPEATSTLPERQIRAVEIRDSAGEPLLRAPLR